MHCSTDCVHTKHSSKSKGRKTLHNKLLIIIQWVVHSHTHNQQQELVTSVFNISAKRCFTFELLLFVVHIVFVTEM